MGVQKPCLRGASIALARADRCCIGCALDGDPAKGLGASVMESPSQP